jgi:hypothetical protein
MERILDNIDPDKFNDKDFINNDIQYFSIDFDFECLNQTIDVNCNFNVFGYEDTGSSGEITEEVFDKNFKEYSVTEIVCTYTGGGDSGYIEDNGYSGDINEIRIPASFEDFMYDMLNSNFGGWENNEGGQGQFVILIEEQTIESREHRTKAQKQA